MAQIITALDLGSFETRALLIKANPKEPPQVLGVGRHPSKGMKKGVVVDINEAAQTVAAVLEMVQNSSGLKIDHIIAAVNGTHLTCANTKGVVAVSRADKEIVQSDIERAIKSAQATLAAPNREIIAVLSRGFSIDNEEGIRNPIGMSGIRLEADTVVISASSPFLRNLSKAISLSGWNASEFVPGPLAAGETLVTKKQKDLGVALLDIGSDTVSVVVYEDGEVLHLDVLPVGSNLITSDIAIGLRIDIDTAETIKVKYGTVFTDQVRKTEMIELRSLGLEENARVRRYEVAEIIEARMREILGFVSRSLDKVGKKNFLPAGIVLVGGGAKLESITELVKKELKLPVRIGFPEQFGGLINEVIDPSFAKAAGLAMWRINQEEHGAEDENSYGQKMQSFLQDMLHRMLP